MNSFKKTMLILLIMTTNFAISQENIWSLQNCIDKALENNIEIKIRQLEIKRVQKSRNSVWNQLLPTVTFNGNQSYTFGSTIDPGTNARVSSNIQFDNFFLNANMNLIDFSAFANAEKNKIEIEKAKVQKEVIENEYKLQLLESYYQALFTQELLKIQKEQFKNAQFNLDRIAKEVEIGSKPKSDLYDIQLSSAQEDKRILETQQLYEIQKKQLFQLMNVTDVLTADVVLISTSSKITAEVSEANANPKIKFAILNYESSLKDLKISRAENLPTLSTFYNISSFYFRPLNQPNAVVESFNNQLNVNKNQQVGIQLSVPVFNGFRNNKKNIAAKITSEKNKLVIIQEQQKIDNQIVLENQNQSNYFALQNKFETTLSFAKASFATTQAKFSSGKIEAIVYSTVKNQVLTAEYEVLKNKFQLDFINLKIHFLRN
ncbi:TolC family protein [Flavobacterium franklandianum]|uniref:TolC family protein n=1 Tax=Flavobacterium franklandianum TaxID=2594430 RepID=UPI00117A0962|nr:TolC family protein [Flavobacterium franklandianum]TRX24601.1 TolC family protein [Flavobacterium franklandianum]